MPVPVNTSTQVQALIDAFVVKGGFRLQLDDVVVPVAVVSDLTVSDENVMCIGGGYVAPVNGGTIGLANPAGSGVKLYVDEAVLSYSANTVVDAGFYGTALANAFLVGFQDLARNAVAVPQGQVRWDDLAAIPVGGNIVEAQRAAGNVLYYLKYDYEISPGQMVWWRSRTNAVVIAGEIKWRELPL